MYYVNEPQSDTVCRMSTKDFIYKGIVHLDNNETNKPKKYKKKKKKKERKELTLFSSVAMIKHFDKSN